MLFKLSNLPADIDYVLIDSPSHPFIYVWVLSNTIFLGQSSNSDHYGKIIWNVINMKLLRLYYDTYTALCNYQISLAAIHSQFYCLYIFLHIYNMVERKAYNRKLKSLDRGNNFQPLKLVWPFCFFIPTLLRTEGNVEFYNPFVKQYASWKLILQSNLRSANTSDL